MRYALLCVLLTIVLLGHSQDTRPNIIFILTDDQRADAIGISGNELIQTPQMDKLAKEGTYYKNAFVTTPICAASRASIMTGLYERTHRYTFQQPPLARPFIETSYYSLTKEAGYHTGFLGKLGVRFEDRMDTALFDFFSPESQGMYFRLANGATTHEHLTDIIGQKAINFIENAPKEQPFALSISFYAPHAVDQAPDQYYWPQSEDDLYQNTVFPLPKIATDKDFDKLPEGVRQGFNRDRWKWRFDTPEKYQEMMRGYYRMISGIDRNLGRIREVLKENGLHENTVIVFMGDNGYFLGERQLAGKWLMYDRSLRVPLIVFDPRTEGGKVSEELALNIDVPATLLDFAQIEIPSVYQGMSLLSGKQRDYFVCEHLWDFEPIPPSEGIRDREYKYFRYINNPELEELYDLAKDPGETKNLILDPEYKKVLKRMKKQLEREISKLSDQ